MRKLKKIVIYIFVLVLLLALAPFLIFGLSVYFSSSDLFAPEEEKDFKRNLSNLILEGKKEFKLNEVVGSKFDKVCVGPAWAKINGKKPSYFLFPENFWILGLISDDSESKEPVIYKMWHRDFYNIDIKKEMFDQEEKFCIGGEHAYLKLLDQCEYSNQKSKCFQLINKEGVYSPMQ